MGRSVTRRAGWVAPLVAAYFALAACHTQPDAVAVKWLRQDCRVGGAGPIESELHAAGAAAETTLLLAYAGGSGVLGDRVAAEARRSYDEVIAALSAGRTHGLSQNEITEFRSRSREAHAADARLDFDVGYRRAALSGLAVIKGPRGIALLRRVALDAHSSDRTTAQKALARAGIALAPPP